MDERYQAVRAILFSRRTFLEHPRALFQYLPFTHWDQWMAFMLDARTRRYQYLDSVEFKLRIAVDEVITGCMVTPAAGG